MWYGQRHTVKEATGCRLVLTSADVECRGLRHDVMLMPHSGSLCSFSSQQAYLSLDGVLYAHNGCLCTLGVCHESAFHLCCANPVAADIDHCMGKGRMKTSGSSSLRVEHGSAAKLPADAIWHGKTSSLKVGNAAGAWR